MRVDPYMNDRHDPFGWLKTLGLILVVFGLMIGTGLMAAKAADNPCLQACQAKHNECRIQTKGGASCDPQLNACRQSCFAELSKQPAVSAPRK